MPQSPLRLPLNAGRAAPGAWLALLAGVVLTPLAPPAWGDCPDKGSCLAPHSNPGCEDEQCCNDVCAADPLCCELGWDVPCAAAAEQICAGLCGANASGSCFVANLTPACDDEVCCELICQIDPFCCAIRWDVTCALFAQLNCESTGGGTCGDAAAGSCFVPHPSPACSDGPCCEGVCQIDPSCCAVVWDSLCAEIAVQICATTCAPTCPPNAMLEMEACGENTNDPCYFPSASPFVQTIPCGGAACGRIRVVSASLRDVDVWKVVLTDGDGDGVVAVQLSFSSAFKGFACLLPANGCPPLASAPIHVDTQLCIELLSNQQCLSPGEYYVVVAPGTWPVLGTTPIVCNDADRYTVRVLCSDAACAPPCGNGGSCFAVSKTPGCADAECCESICASDPSCCAIQWDAECVAAAIAGCATVPDNDHCGGAIAIGTGNHAFTTIGATDGPPGAGCVGRAAIKDLWYRFTPTAESILVVATCGAPLDFDSAISVYGGTCGALQPLACNDDGGGSCLPTFASQVLLPVSCDETYYIRVGGGLGSGTLSLLQSGGSPCPSPCPADLNSDGLVGAADLAILLGGWSTPGPGDLSGDGTVGAADLAILLGAWGPCG